jgi:hypothetical protein
MIALTARQAFAFKKRGVCIGLFRQTAVICRFDARADGILLLMFSYHEPLGRLARWPLKAIPKN